MVRTGVLRFVLAPIVAGGVALTGFAHPVQSTEVDGVRSVQLVAIYNVVVSCQLVRYTDGVAEAVGYIEGYGSASNYADARNIALRDANSQVPRGHYKRHCKDGPARRGGGGRF